MGFVGRGFSRDIDGLEKHGRLAPGGPLSSDGVSFMRQLHFKFKSKIPFPESQT
jgi:hypothetical protein